MSDSSDRNFLPNTDTFSFQNNNDYNSQSSSSSSSNNNNNNNNVKETGIIEKMIQSYGFIQCCERQARLFFHFSQFLGNPEHLKIGDPVEYETSFDKRTGKPVATNIKKIASNDFMSQLSQSDRLSGVIATEITNDREGRVAYENMGEFFFIPFGNEDNVNNVKFKANDKVTFVLYMDVTGNYRATRVQLEESDLVNNQGIISAIKDTFGFIERSDSMTKIFFHTSDCHDFKSLNVGDFVQFNITTRKGKDLAVNVIKQANSDEEFSEKIYKGQVIKYNNSRTNLASGLVYCPELKKEFFFYEKDVKGNFTLNALDLVTFQIATDRRTHYQRAINIVFLPETFIINSETREKGYVASLKDTYGFIKSPNKEGSLIYFKVNELIDSTVILKLNDEVEFTFITDVQARKCQAIRISLLPNGTLFNNIITKKQHQHPQQQPSSTNHNNNITSMNHNNNNNNNIFNNNNNNTINENVTEDFNLIDLSCPHIYNNNNNSADSLKDTQQFKDNGIKFLMNGNTNNNNNNNGDSDNFTNSQWTKELLDIFQKNENLNLNNYSSSTSTSTSSPWFNGNNINNSIISGGISNGNIDFSEQQHLSQQQQSTMINNTTPPIPTVASIIDGLGNGIKKNGIIVLLKDNYGFIESLDGENEYYFHITSLNDENLLLSSNKLGQFVEFEAYFTNGKWKAMNVRKLSNENFLNKKFENDLSTEIFNGKVIRTIRMFDNEQNVYTGLIAKIPPTPSSTNTTNDLNEIYEFSMISMKFFKDFICVGDSVRFQLATNPITKKKRAYNVELIRDRLKGTIISLQRMYGFLKPENTSIVGNVYFNSAEIRQDQLAKIKAGDKVDFYLIKNKKADKYYAIDINKLDEIQSQSSTTTTSSFSDLSLFKKNFLNLKNNDNGPKVIVIRQPKAPDGTKGFVQQNENLT